MRSGVRIKVRPTLFIGCGGAGAEVLIRLRRRILDADWGGNRISSLSRFPVAAFLSVDFDIVGPRARERTQTDLFSNQVIFDPDEVLSGNVYIGEYIQDIKRFPWLNEWLPTNQLKEYLQAVKDALEHYTSIPSTPRFASRLWLFHNADRIRESIRQKYNNLQPNLSNTAGLDALKLDTQRDVRIVIVCTSARGTGPGMFLDMGYLAKSIAPESQVDLVCILGGGFEEHNKELVGSNTYAALMELEYCMQGNRYVNRWTEWGPVVPDGIAPFNEVYLLDTKNMTGQSTGIVGDIYEMVADVFFEDFRGGDFAAVKRSVAVNQMQFKIFPYAPPLGEENGSNHLRYSRAYSSFGQAILETKAQSTLEARIIETSIKMIRAFSRGKQGEKRDTPLTEAVEVIESLEQEWKRLQARNKVCNAMRIDIKEITPVPPLVELAKAGEWAEEALQGLEGSQNVYEMLKTRDGRFEFVSRLIAYARRQLADGIDDDVMFNTLSNLNETQRKEVFKNLLERAMPWLNAKVTGLFSTAYKEDQCRAYIAVKGVERYKRSFGAVLDDVVSSFKEISARCVNFVESGSNGRIICYAEISGIPLDVIEPLKTTWRRSYIEMIRSGWYVTPHNHKDSSRFPHPVVPDAKEISRMKRDLRLFLEAVALGILRRRDDDSKAYEFDVEPSGRVSIGSEGWIRSVGFTEGQYIQIVDEVRRKVDVLTNLQHLSLSVSFSYMAEMTYWRRKLSDPDRTERLISGFGRIQAEALAKDYMIRVIQMMTKESIAEPRRALYENMAVWTVEIPGSREDVDLTEVDPEKNKPKRVVRPEIFTRGWLEKNVPLITSGHCPNQQCGTETSPSDKFCHNCGTKLKG